MKAMDLTSKSGAMPGILPRNTKISHAMRFQMAIRLWLRTIFSMLSTITGSLPLLRKTSNSSNNNVMRKHKTPTGADRSLILRAYPQK